MARTIELKVVDTGTMQDAEGKEIKRPNFSYRENFLALLAAQVNDGLTIGDIGKLLKPYGKLEDAKDGDLIVLEDEEYKTVKEHLGKVRFVVFNRWLGEMMADFENAPEMDLQNWEADMKPGVIVMDTPASPIGAKEANIEMEAKKA